MDASVFISHSSRDRKIAETLCHALETRGIGCWLSSRDIAPGQNFQEAIVKALRSCRAMLMVFTANANNSDEIKKELALASQNHLAVIPVRVEDVVPTDAFAYEFATRQWVDVFKDWDTSIERLAAHVQATLNSGTAAPVAMPTPPPPPKRWPLAVAAVIALVLILGGGFAWMSKRPQAVATAPAAPAAPQAAALDLTGKWISGRLANPYAENDFSILHFEFEQKGDSLLGTVVERTGGGRGDRKGIRGGDIRGGEVSFFTQGMVSEGSDLKPYKETYRGTYKDGVIDFVRQNDVASGGLPEKFTARREAN
jgi:hypothetical protein